MTRLGVFTEQQARTIAQYVDEQMRRGIRLSESRINKKRTPYRGGGGGAGVTFSADAAFTVNDMEWAATVVESWGGAAANGETITVKNLLIDVNLYMFKGDQFASGIALKVDGDKYQCIQLECSPGDLPSDWNPA